MPKTTYIIFSDYKNMCTIIKYIQKWVETLSTRASVLFQWCNGEALTECPRLDHCTIYGIRINAWNVMLIILLKYKQEIKLQQCPMLKTFL